MSAQAASPAAIAMPARDGNFSSAAYWEQRYRLGGHSGAGSRGRLARYKARFLNTLIRDNDVASAIEFGCGDGDQLAMLDVADYVGIDVAPEAVRRCGVRFAGVPGRQFRHAHDLAGLDAAELGLSLDVVYHLVEDAVFIRYMDELFAHAWRFVVVYASDIDAAWPGRHVRHRRFTAHVARYFPEWRLAAVMPNPYPYDPQRPDETSFAAFHVFCQAEEACHLTVPAVDPDDGVPE